MFDFSEIQFDMRDWYSGFFITFRIPFSMDNYDAVLAFENSAEIRLIK